jgi:histidinol-phosphate aminotransferase
MTRPKPTGAPAVPARAAVVSLKPYACVNRRAAVNGRAANDLKLDWNESTEPPSPVVFERLSALLGKGQINWYGDPTAARLVRRLAEYTGFPPSRIQVFNGSDSALDYIARTFVGPGDHVLIAAPSYDNFRVFVAAQDARVEHVFAPDPFKRDVPGLLARIQPDTRLVYLCNPNNPTGVMYSPADISRILARLHRGILLVDEAYFEFTGVTATPLLARHANLVVTRSFSKAFGLAGVRCGYAIASRALLSQVNRIRNGKDVNVLAQVAALAALDDLPHMRRWVGEVRRSRTWLVRHLRARGYDVRPSPANFVLVGVDDPRRLVAQLRMLGIFVRDRSTLPGLSRYVRVTVGTRSESERLVAALDRVEPGSIARRLTRPPRSATPASAAARRS